MLGPLDGDNSPSAPVPLDRDDLLSFGRQRSRHVLGRRRVVDEYLQARAERQLLQRQLGAHEGEGTYLAGEVERHHVTSTSQRIRVGTSPSLTATMGWSRLR